MVAKKKIKIKNYCVSSTLWQALDFLAELFKNGIGYSGINTFRSSLSCIIKPQTLGSHLTVTRYLKRVFF